MALPVHPATAIFLIINVSGWHLDDPEREARALGHRIEGLLSVRVLWAARLTSSANAGGELRGGAQL
jgi:hypothetical protein